jgi:hypothetical protein
LVPPELLERAVLDVDRVTRMLGLPADELRAARAETCAPRAGAPGRLTTPV